MDNREHFNETEYLEGFNLGYRMTKDFPELAEFLDHTRGYTDKLDGLKDGRSQYLEEQLEKNQEKGKSKGTSPSWLLDDRLDKLDKKVTKNKYRDKDIEPDI